MYFSDSTLGLDLRCQVLICTKIKVALELSFAENGSSIIFAVLDYMQLRVLGHLAVRGRAALLRVLSQKLKQLQGCNKDLRRGLCLYSMQQHTQGSNSNI